MTSQLLISNNFLKAGTSKSLLILTSSIFKLSWEMEAKFDINFPLF